MPTPQVNPVLAGVFDRIAADCADLVDPWWVFGGAAMALVGAPGLSPPDVDLIVSEPDARRLLARWRIDPVPPQPSPLFRSRLFARAHIAALPIEIMAGFESCSNGHWTPVSPATRRAFAWNGATLYAPDAAEQADICRRFGRPKDLARLPLLVALGA